MRLTLVYGLGHGDSDPQAVSGLGAVGRSQVLAVGQLEPLEDERVGAGDDVLRLAQVVLQDLALVLAQVPGFVGAGAAVARGEGKVAEGGDGELGAAVGQVVGRPDHGEGRWRHKRDTHSHSCARAVSTKTRGETRGQKLETNETGRVFL